jgi:hypothetical protein
VSPTVFELIELTRDRQRRVAVAAALAHRWTAKPTTGWSALAASDAVRGLARRLFSPEPVAAPACCSA